MMTLVLITVLMGLVSLILTQSSRITRLGENSFSQSTAMLLVSDLERQLPTLLASISGAEQLDLAFRIPLQLETKKGDFILQARLASPYKRFNINLLLTSDGKVNEPYVALFTKLFAAYPIADADIFLKLIFDTIDLDTAERGIDTEIALTRPDFKNGPIASARQFHLILERYIELTGDTTILSIAWDKYIGYEGDKMDFNAVNPEVLSLMIPSISQERVRALTLYRTKAYTTKEEAIAVEPLLAPLFDTYFFIYKPGTSYNLICDVRLQQNFRKEHVKFFYNLTTKKVQYVEFI